MALRSGASEPATPRARRARRVGCWATVVVFLLAIAPYTYYVITDADPPDDRDLLPLEREAGPVEEDAYPLVIAAIEGIEEFDYEAIDEVLADSPVYDPDTGAFRFDEREKWGGTEAEQIAALIEGTRATVAAVREALGRPGFDSPRPDPNSMDAIPLSEYRDLQQWIHLHADIALLEGRPDEALESYSLALELGNRIGKNAHTLIELLVGVAIEHQAQVHWERALPHLGLGDAELAAMATRFEAIQVPVESLVRTMRFEYTFGKHFIELYDSAFLFKKNRTLVLIIEKYRHWFRQQERLYIDREYPEDTESGFLTKALHLLSGNSLGYALVESSMLLPVSIDERLLSMEFRRRLRTVFIALERHHLRHGELPPDLETLVPELLAEIPLDPFTATPIQYDPVRGVLWGAGSDGIDSGGSLLTPGDAVIDPLEPTVAIPRAP